MAPYGTSAQRHEANAPSRSRKLMSTGLFWRVLFALVVSLLIVMAFFATTALSH